MVERGTSLLNKMEISVAEAEKRTGKNTVNMQETYTVYLIETRWTTPLFAVWHRALGVAVTTDKCASYFILSFLFSGKLRVSRKGAPLPRQTPCGDATVSLNCSEHTSWSPTLTSSSLHYRRNGWEAHIWKGKHSDVSFAEVLVGWYDWNPFATICFCRCIIVVAPLAGRVCVAQTVCRQPRPRLCWAAESRPGKLLAARCITPCPLQW